MEDDEEIDLTPVEYARCHGLAVHHLLEPLPLGDIKRLQEHLPEHLTRDEHLQQIQTSFPPAEDRLTLNKDAAKLLSDANRIPLVTQESDYYLTSLLDVQKTRRLRVETPLLRSHHESDYRAFGRYKQPNLTDIVLPLEILDEERSEGLSWSNFEKKIPRAFLKKIYMARIDVQKETLFYLQDLLKDEWGKEDEDCIWEEGLKYKRTRALEPLTPPLLPTTLQFEPYIPSSPACHLPLLSDPPSLSEEDLEKAEKEIVNERLSKPRGNTDIITASSQKEEALVLERDDTASPGSYIMNNLSSPLIRTQKIQDLKVEVPLMPIAPKAARKAVSFDPQIEEMLLDPLWKEDAFASLSGTCSPADETSSVENLLKDVFKVGAELGMQKIEQERLQEADTTSRVTVPHMDFTKPCPPWKHKEPLRNIQEIKHAQKCIIGDGIKVCGKPPIWPGLQKLMHLLCWIPFPAVTVKVELDETINESINNETTAFLTNSSDDEIIGSDEVVWKRSGLRILRQTDDEEEDDDNIGLGDFKSHQQPQDLMSLAKKKKKHPEEEEIDSSDSLPNSLTQPLPKRRQPQMIHKGGINNRARYLQPGSDAASASKSSVAKRSVDTNDIETGLLLDKSLSTGDGLENYLKIMGSKKQKLTDSTYFANTSATRKPQTPISRTQLTDEIPFAGERLALYLPPVTAPDVPTPVIIALPLMKRRALIHTLANIIPTLVLIERDFEAYNLVAWTPGSVSRSPVASTLADEADLIISPSTGIILTTLQKIKQRPLPGQKAKAEIQSRLEKLSLRYEQLIIIISAGPTEEHAPSLDPSDCLALSTFNGFCASLEPITSVHTVSGGDDVLATWLAAIIIRYGVSEALLVDETIWELFLRRTGLNAFAAQAVLALLKAPEGVDAGSPCKAGFFGLTGFVDLTAEERNRRFSTLLGGTKVLRRVGRVLEQGWM